MIKTRLAVGTALSTLAVLVGMSAPTLAQDIDFGDDTSEWANDGECDDPRFTGSGMAAELEDVDIGKDATDCRAAFDAGTITLISGGTPATPPPLPTTDTDIDFGDDSSEWANDGECDDMRFTGTGMAAELEDVDTGRDATDCRTLYDAGEITLVEAGVSAGSSLDAAPASDIDFGDDTSPWAKDGECDDPRFTGRGMAEALEDADIGKDATDCREAFEAGDITLASESDTAEPAEIDFGDDSSEWAKDEECDDPRFSGHGMAGALSDENILRDATDCRNAFNDGTITFVGEGGSTSTAAPAWLEAIAGRIDFGDDSSDWANDGECDDPDFVGPGAVSAPSDDDRMRDASDCRAAFIAGTVTLMSTSASTDFDYGSDFSEWANDGQCDDWRFTGPGMAKKLSADDVLGDASDCRMLEEEGQVSIKPVYQPSYALNGPYDSSDVDFGDNSSSYANDNICDDPRFEGPGVATTLLDSDRRADAADCRAAYEEGTIVLRDGEA